MGILNSGLKIYDAPFDPTSPAEFYRPLRRVEIPPRPLFFSFG